MRCTVRRIDAGRWRTPRPRPFRPVGIALGAHVRFDGHRTGQVWAPAPGARMWWVVTPDGVAVARHERFLTLLRQCVEQEEVLTA